MSSHETSASCLELAVPGSSVEYRDACGPGSVSVSAGMSCAQVVGGKLKKCNEARGNTRRQPNLDRARVPGAPNKRRAVESLAGCFLLARVTVGRRCANEKYD